MVLSDVSQYSISVQELKGKALLSNIMERTKVVRMPGSDLV